MRKINFFNACVLALVVLMSACSKVNAPFTNVSNKTETLEDKGTEGMNNSRHSEEFREAKSIMRSVHPEVANYFNNIKSVMYATNSLEKPAQFRSTNNETDSPKNPIIEKLKALNIYDDDSGKKLDFFDLPNEQKELFIDDLLASEANDMNLKLSSMPGLDKIIAEENKIANQVIEEERINKIKVGEEVSETFRSSNGLVSSEKFFAKIQKGYEELYGKQVSQEEARSVLGTIVGGFAIAGAIVTDIKDLPIIPVERVITKWAQCSRRGDFILALPSHGRPWKFINFGKGVRFMVGHAGILTKKITKYTNEDDDTSLEAYYSDGVQRHSPENWITPHYVMGIQKVSYRWRWRGFRSGFYKVKRPVSNPGALADWAKKYEGKKYVRVYEHPYAKWVAPSRFTCTTLVWYCAKKAYGVNVSSWWATFVSPSGLYTDDCTYFRGEVK